MVGGELRNERCVNSFPIVLFADMQWHRPVTALSSSSSMTMQSTQNSKPKQMNSSIPFRELLLQQQQQQQQQLLQQQTKLLADSSATSSIASGINSSGGSVPTTATTEITASAIISSSAVEQDRIAMFQERDRLILQHQQHQLQRKHQKQLNEHEKPFSTSNRIRDFVIGGGVDRVTNIAAGKTSGKWPHSLSLTLVSPFHYFFQFLCTFLNTHHQLHPNIYNTQCLRSVWNVCNLQFVGRLLCW